MEVRVPAARFGRPRCSAAGASAVGLWPWRPTPVCNRESSERMKGEPGPSGAGAALAAGCQERAAGARPALAAPPRRRWGAMRGGRRSFLSAERCAQSVPCGEALAAVVGLKP